MIAEREMNLEGKKKKNFWDFSSSNKGIYENSEEGVKELQKKIKEYFEEGHNVRKVYDSRSESVQEIPVLTITGLCLYLGFCDRRSFYDYEKKELFSHTIKKARTFLETEYEEMLQTGNATAAIFALKNFGWKDTQTVEGEMLNKNIEMKYVDAPHANIDEDGNVIGDNEAESNT